MMEGTRTGNYITVYQDGVFITTDIRGAELTLRELPRDETTISCDWDGSVCPHPGRLYLSTIGPARCIWKDRFVDTKNVLSPELDKFVELWRDMHAAISILPQPIAEEIIPHLLFKLGIYRKWYGAHRFEEKYESGHTVWETKHWE